MKIADLKLSPKSPKLIVEAGLSHLGSYDLALHMAEQAAAAGCWAFKWQMFDRHAAERLYSGPRKPDRTLTWDQSNRLIDECEKLEIQPIVTPHEPMALSYCLDHPKLPILKIGSGEIGNLPFYTRAAKSDKLLIVSLRGDAPEAENDIEALLKDRPNVIWMHTVGMYPTPFQEAKMWRLKTLQSMANRDQAYGYSCHVVDEVSLGAAFMALSLGATIIERHFMPDMEPLETSNDHRVATSIYRVGDYHERLRLGAAAL